jgi:hypothetical protein
MKQIIYDGKRGKDAIWLLLKLLGSITVMWVMQNISIKDIENGIELHIHNSRFKGRVRITINKGNEILSIRTIPDDESQQGGPWFSFFVFKMALCSNKSLNDIEYRAIM